MNFFYLCGAAFLTFNMVGSVLASTSDLLPKEIPLTQYVDPMIGTDRTPPFDSGSQEDSLGGFTTPAVQLPFGMVQWGPDTPGVPGKWSPPGYHYSQNRITGFSMTHVSGVGCDAGGAFPIFPATEEGQLGGSSFSHENETAKPGYYKVLLDNGVNVELTATLRTGATRLTYPAGKPAILKIIGKTNRGVGNITTVEGDEKALSGWTMGGDFCNNRQYYKLYFYARLDQPFTSKIDGNTATLTFNPSSKKASDLVVGMKVGLSYVSVDNAKLNLESESVASFDAIRAQADASWNQYLNAIQVSGGSDEDTKKFYTGLYHAFTGPAVFSDVNGDYLGFDDEIHKTEAGRVHYTNFSNWDIYRSLIPLLSILSPRELSDMMTSLIADAQQCGGIFPQWVEGNTTSNVMAGDSASIVVAQSYFYGANQFDLRKALGIMFNTALGECQKCKNVTILPGLDDYCTLGYLPADRTYYDFFNRNGNTSTTVEYANTDFAISQFALALGNAEMAKKLLLRSGNWKNHFNPNWMQVPGQPYPQLQPRNADGRWTAYTPGPHGYVEGNAEQYTWMVPYDIQGLFEKLGGEDQAINRLDSFFTYINAGSDDLHMWIGNEPSFATPWLYNWTAQPFKTQQVVRRIVNTQFTTRPSGLPGNDDVGALSGWLVWGALGLYPAIPAVPGLTIASPLFPKTVVKMGNGKVLTINAANASSTYIQSVKLNGYPYDSSWLPFNAIRDGATLDITLGDKPSTWGTQSNARPPSFPAR
ncbi:GH92 family glycosyl hydrolase [Mycetohabitans sp. B6]|uniref:GH92 family glycosyl hydrolase n=1 Tax=Mycetohabitans sp. B6 TaxID=2841843 RepID=UPI001EFFC16A|nr:GH92 family glycosyl hydrolase [Mycetohabitans sp. B6]MCG1047277.1 GH92 family glycosyl hydrolase [Mycetohabitans sp. B6]